jgi:ankyrin repeat protein
MWAASSGYLSVVEFLMKSGADVNARCPIRRSALMDATSEGHGNVVDLLLEHGANPCLVSSQGRKAYDMAAESGHEALAESLRAAEGQYSRWEGSDAKRAWIVAALFSKPSASCLAVGGASAAPAPV